MYSPRSTDLLDLLAGKRTDEEVARAHGVSVEEVRQWRRIYADGLEAGLAQRGRSRRWMRASLTTLGLVAALSVAVSSGEAFSQASCSPTGVFTRLGLKFMCANQPALASDVNFNAEQMVALMEQKLGTVGDGTAIRNAGGVTTPALDAGAVLAGGLFAGSLRANAITTPALDAGVVLAGVLIAGSLRANDVATPSLDAGVVLAGELQVTGQISGGSLRQSACNWVETNLTPGADDQYHSVVCPAGKFQVGWRCYAVNSLDGNCAIRCCTP